MGAACMNCGVGANQQCPKFGCTSTAGANLCVTGSALADDTVCTGTGPCGPANSTFQTLAFSILDISPGDIALVTNCDDASLNTPVQPALPNIYAANSQNPVSLQLIYPNTGPDATTRGCQVNNAAGWQKDYIVNHVALYTGGRSRFTATSHGYITQMLSNALINSIAYFGGSGSGIFCSSGTGCLEQGRIERRI